MPVTRWGQKRFCIYANFTSKGNPIATGKTWSTVEEFIELMHLAIEGEPAAVPTWQRHPC